MPYNDQNHEGSGATNPPSAYARLLALMGAESCTPSAPEVEGVPALPPGPFPLPRALYKSIVGAAATVAARVVGERKIDVDKHCANVMTAAASGIVEKALDPAAGLLSPEARNLLAEARDSNLKGLALLGLWFALRRTEGLKWNPRLEVLVATFSADEESRFAAVMRLARKANTGRPKDQAAENVARKAYLEARMAGWPIEAAVAAAGEASGKGRRWVFDRKWEWEG